MNKSIEQEIRINVSRVQSFMLYDDDDDNDDDDDVVYC